MAQAFFGFQVRPARSMRACAAVAAVFLLSAARLTAQQAFTRTLTFDRGEHALRDFFFSPEVVFDAGNARLARSTLLCHETGSTDHRQTEALSATTWVKIRFQIDAPPAEDAEILLFGSAREALLNDEKLDAPTKLVSTGWSRIRVPASKLKSGINEVVLRGGGSLLVEPGRPGQSLKSTDGGRTWSNEGLTGAGDAAGAYLVRLRLPQHAARGTATSRLIDLWDDAPMASARSVDEIALVQLPDRQPEATSLKAYVRLGPTRAAGDKSWTGWMPLLGAQKLDGKLEGMRWLQVKFELHTADANASPRLPQSVQLTWKGRREPPAPTAIVAASAPAAATLHPSPTPFVYEKPMPRLEHLRKRYKLDEVIAAGKTEMEQFMLLRYWVRNQWHTAWGSHAAAWMPPWDALVILECKDQPECLTMCTHYAAVFTQCCQALGWNARHCILDHHCVSEVYSFEHDRWIMMDAGNSAQRADVGLHFQRRGVPLSARELHLAHRNKDLDGITVHFTPWELSKKIQHLCREAPRGKSDPSRPDLIPLEDLKKFPVCQIENYRRYAFPGRNTFLTSILPGELYQGWAEYFHDGYYWVGDSADGPRISPEYSRHLDPRRADDVDWKLGGTRVDLALVKGQLQVDLESLMPNHARFEVFDGAWRKTPPRLVIPLTEAKAELRVRSVNAWGKAGRPSTVTITAK